MFLNKKKKKTKVAEDANAPANLWKAEKITVDEIMEKAAADFLHAGAMFYDGVAYVKKNIKKRKEGINEYLEFVEHASTEAGYQGRGLIINLLARHKAERADIIDWLSFRNQVHLMGGTIPFWYVCECIQIRPDNAFDIDKENMLKLCALPHIKEKTYIKLNDSASAIHPDEPYVLPTTEQLSFFYDAAAQYMKLTIEEQAGLPSKTSDMFDERGLIMLRDENGEFHLAEEDYFLDYVEIDYKGLV